MVRLYLDENVNILLAALLRARNIEVTTALESNMLGKSDEGQIEFAQQGRSAIVTHNRVDFESLFRMYAESGKQHYGIIILIRRNVYEMSKRLSRFALSYDHIQNQLWYV